MSIGTSNDPEKRLNELKKKEEDIKKEIFAIEQGHSDRLDSTKIKESFQLIEETAGKLLSDFRQIEENFRKLNTQAREDQIKKQITRGKFLDNVFKAHDLIMETDQGKSFIAFWEFLMDQSKQEEMNGLIEDIFQLPELSSFKSKSTIPYLKIGLVEAGDRVNKTTDHLIEQLRKFLESRIYMENKRILDVIKQIESEALNVKNEVPAASNFVEIEDKASVSLVMERELFEPPKNPNISSGDIQEGVADIDTSILFEQLFINPEALKERIKIFLRRKDQITLKEVIEEIPLEKGMAELITYFSIATKMEKENKAVIKEEIKEVIYYTVDKKSFKIELPQTIFVK